MSQWTLYYNPQCSKCREALSLLETHALDFQTVEYLKNPLNAAGLKELMNELIDPVSSLVRVKEREFTEAPFNVNSIDEIAQHLAQKPHLMERPILRGNRRAVIGRPVEKLIAIADTQGK